MKNALTRMICRVVIVMMVWTPFQLAHAGMIGTDQVVVSSTQAERSAVLAMINRADVARELASYGVDLSTAQDRVAALTDAEVRSLAGKLHSAPAGADGAGVAVLILVGVVLWLVFWKK